jgi:hypothetical protein
VREAMIRQRGMACIMNRSTSTILQVVHRSVQVDSHPSTGTRIHSGRFCRSHLHSSSILHTVLLSVLLSSHRLERHLPVHTAVLKRRRQRSQNET